MTCADARWAVGIQSWDPARGAARGRPELSLPKGQGMHPVWPCRGPPATGQAHRPSPLLSRAVAAFTSFLIFLTRTDATAADGQPVGVNGKADPAPRLSGNAMESDKEAAERRRPRLQGWWREPGGSRRVGSGCPAGLPLPPSLPPTQACWTRTKQSLSSSSGVTCHPISV